MNGGFKPGQLVRTNSLMISENGRLDLFNVPGGIVRTVNDQVRCTAWLEPGDVALLVARERTVAGDVYVLGPHGGGWAPGALLRIISEPVVETYLLGR